MENENDKGKRDTGLPGDGDEDRNRLYFVADAEVIGSGAGLRDREPGAERRIQPSDRGLLGDPSGRGRGIGGDEAQPGSGGHADGTVELDKLGDTVQPGLEGHSGDGAGCLRQEREVSEQDRPACEADVSDGQLAEPDREHGDGERSGSGNVCRERGSTEIRRGATNGFWRNAVWLPCRDGKSRPTAAGIHPLVAGTTKPSIQQMATRTSGGVVCGGNPGLSINPNAAAEARVMRLRGYGNSLTSEVACEFIKAYLHEM